MILGIGTDLVEINRIKKILEKNKDVSHLFTNKEMEIFGKNPTSLSGNFSGKEALVKALGTGFRKITPKDIEVFRDKLGAPYIILSEKAHKILKEKGVNKIHISISNTKDYAVSYVILEE